MAVKIGIDPGITGAIALLPSSGDVFFMDMPTTERQSGKGEEVSAPELYRMLMGIKCQGLPAHVYLENVTAMPSIPGRDGQRRGMGATSAFNFGRTVGVIQACVACANISMTLVTPQSWKKRAGLIGKDKDAARTRALQLYPSLAPMLSRKKDIGRADALLIAHFSEQQK